MLEDSSVFEFGPAVGDWLVVLAVLAGVGLTLALLAAVAGGGAAALRRFFPSLGAALRDMVLVSPRRVGAVAQLTVREAVRRRALFVFVLFAVLFMFAGWFLSNSGERAADRVTVYVSFVLTTIGWLVLPVMLLLACWGIPEDIRLRSLHTVVTKPVRRGEVVLGRILGYGLIGTLLVAVMGLFGAFWIVRQTDESVQREALVARVPVYGDLQFYDKEGSPAEAGINVGYMFEYRGYIEGATRARAVYTFEGVDGAVLRDVVFETDGERETRRVMQLESDFEAFRTVKGDIDRGLQVSYTYVNPETGLSVEDPSRFYIEEFDGNVHNVPVEITSFDPDSGETRTVDLLRDLVAPDGRLLVEVRCLNPQQYLGMGVRDLFIRQPDRSFWVTYSKAIAGVWFKTLLIVLLGVTASCFLKGPVATLLVFTLLIVGQSFRAFMEEIVDLYYAGDLDGGGPLESMLRIVSHKNMISQLEPGPQTAVVQGLDAVFFRLLWAMEQIIPDFAAFNFAPYAAKGFDVSFYNNVLPAALLTVAFAVPCYVVATLCLRFRELEAK